MRDAKVGFVSSGASNASLPSVEDKIAKAQEEKTKLCILGVRQQHGAWDKCEREFHSMMTQANTGNNTMNSPVKDTLEEIIHLGEHIDKELKGYEQTYMGG